MWLWEEVTSKAWCWVMWLCPTTLALPSCHNSRFKILTNMAWHPWPSSPIYEPLLFPSLHHLYPISQLSSLLFTSWRCVQWTLPPVPSDTLPSCQNDVPDNEHPKCFSLGCWRLLPLFCSSPLVTFLVPVKRPDLSSNFPPEAGLCNSSFITSPTEVQKKNSVGESNYKQKTWSFYV